jgi:hypothetical protein
MVFTTIGLIMILIGLIEYRIGFLGIVIFFLSIFIVGIQLNNTYIKSKNEIPFTTIKQEIDGRYFIVDKEYNKLYPDVKIVQSNTKYVKSVEGYKFLDWATMDKTSYILYLNLKDMSK